MPCVNGVVVGIFSREDPTSYQWLIHEVKSVSGVQDVRPVTITNTWSHFDKRVSECSFAILYHSKRRGRLNVTDVTDSLYDDELRVLSRALGKEKVIVVMDHVENRSEKQKTRILKEQSSIGRLASDLLLANDRHTKKQELQNLRTSIKRHTRRYRIPKLAIFLLLFIFVLIIIIVFTLPGAEIASTTPGYSTVTATPGIATVTSTPGNFTVTSTPGIATMTSTPGIATVTSTPGNFTVTATPGNFTMTATPGNFTVTSIPGNFTVTSTPENATGTPITTSNSTFNGILYILFNTTAAARNATV
ncbi:uncharacterized protein ACNLHF_025824 isoform 1-T2 [Anomaloglossus baeobatrachus]|uniref:uncharacterized protein LOC142246565 n=1 Tax=Anomaloglossus baeobatrachus TaxID=238106 RepID=UPI003F4FAC66